jgi:hypothetical protein
MNQWLTTQIPYSAEQGIFHRLAANFAKSAGICSSVCSESVPSRIQRNKARLENTALKAAQRDTKALITFVGLLARSGALNEADNTSATSLPETSRGLPSSPVQLHTSFSGDVFVTHDP